MIYPVQQAANPAPKLPKRIHTASSCVVRERAASKASSCQAEKVVNPPRTPVPSSRRAESLGAHRSFVPNGPLPRKVPAVIDNVGAESWGHSLSSLARGGTLVTVGGTTGFDVPLNLLPVFADQLTITGSIMGTLNDMEDMMRLLALAGIEPEIGSVLAMERAEEGFRAMWEGKTRGKTVFTR